MAGTASSASTMAHPIRWVNETLPPPRCDASHRLTTRRFSSSSFAGTNRNEVAVGISSEAAMFDATLAATPESGFAPSMFEAGGCAARRVGRGLASRSTSDGSGAGGEGDGPCRGGGLAERGVGRGLASRSEPAPWGAPTDPSPSAGEKPSKNSRQSGPTDPGSSRYRRYSSSISHMFGPRAEGSNSSGSLIAPGDSSVMLRRTSRPGRDDGPLSPINAGAFPPEPTPRSRPDRPRGASRASIPTRPRPATNPARTAWSPLPRPARAGAVPRTRRPRPAA